jgi:hypothetical protein
MTVPVAKVTSVPPIAENVITAYRELGFEPPELVMRILQQACIDHGMLLYDEGEVAAFLYDPVVHPLRLVDSYAGFGPRVRTDIYPQLLPERALYFVQVLAGALVKEHAFYVAVSGKRRTLYVMEYPQPIDWWVSVYTWEEQ